MKIQSLDFQDLKQNTTNIKCALSLKYIDGRASEHAQLTTFSHFNVSDAIIAFRDRTWFQKENKCLKLFWCIQRRYSVSILYASDEDL